MEKSGRAIYDRGNSTDELACLASAMIHLINRRYWILGVRQPVEGIRFDLVAQLPSAVTNVILVEVKYRADRPVRPGEVGRFAEEVATVRKGLPESQVTGVFMTNSSFSKGALEAIRKHRLQGFSHVPMLFDTRPRQEVSALAVFVRVHAVFI
jgi:restriction endonuclease